MKEGKTLLLTTHFMEESDALSDRILMISNGNIKADGTYGSGKILLPIISESILSFCLLRL